MLVLRPASEPGILSTHLHADGSYKDLLYCPGGASQGSPARDELHSRRVIAMAGNEVFRLAVMSLGRAVDEALSANRLERSAIDWLGKLMALVRNETYQAGTRETSQQLKETIALYTLIWTLLIQA